MPWTPPNPTVSLTSPLTPPLSFPRQIDHDYWGRPEEEDLDAPRPSYTWNDTTPSSDLKSAATAALVATSLAFSETDPDLAERCMSNARVLFASAAGSEGRYSKFSEHKKAAAVYKSASHLVRSGVRVGDSWSTIQWCCYCLT